MSYGIDSASVTDRKNTPQPAHPFSTTSHASSMSSLPDPFSSSMNHVFFSGADRRILLDEVIHLCQFGNNLVAAIGDDGVGKTAFLNQARFELSETAFCCLLNGNESMTPEDIFSQLISQLELPVSSVSTAGEMIATLRHAMAEGNMHRVVVIIDDAHLLQDTILSALISLLQGHQGQHLHILMSGKKSLVDRLDNFDMVDVLVYDVTLNPFTLQDTKEYLDYKLTAAGYPSEKLLDESQVESIWKESGGYPTQINRVADRHIFQQDFDIAEEGPSASGLPLVHMALLVVLLAGLILALIYMGNDGEDASVGKLDAQANVDVPTGLNLEPEKVIENGSVSSPSAEADESSNLLEGVSKQQGPELASIGGAEPEQNKAEIPSLKNENQLSIVKSTEEVNPTNIAIPSLPQSSKSVLQEALKQELKKEAELLSVDQSELKGNGGSLPGATEGSLLNTAKGSLSSTAKGSLSNTAGASKSSEVKELFSLSEDEGWLLSLNDSGYVLQVIAAGQRQSVKKFIDSQPNKGGLRLIRVGRDGKPWYIVVTGNYTDRVSARKAIQSLPQDQVNGGPWPRKVLDLKQEIKAFRTK